MLRHARIEATLLARNGEQLLLALVIPVGVLVLGRIIGGSFGNLSVLAPSVLALAVWSSTFTSVAISTGFERRYGVLERLACTPLGRAGLLTGKALATGCRARSAGGDRRRRPGAGVAPDRDPVGVLLAVPTVLLAGVAFSGLALALAGRLRAEATLALANVIYVLLLAGGALVLPLDRYPGGRCSQSSSCCPPPRSARDCGRTRSVTSAVAAASLLIWSGLGLLAAWKGFRWTS